MLAGTWSLLAESAPYLLAGFALAGVVEAALAGAWIARWLSGERLGSVLAAALLGVPLPLCSCSVVPTAVALRRRGAGRGATVSFLVSTPETSVTSILLTYALLGPVLAVARPVAATITAIVAGAAESARAHGRPLSADGGRRATTGAGDGATAPGAAGPSPGATSAAAAGATPHARADSACASGEPCGDEGEVDPRLVGAAPSGGPAERLRRGLRFAFVDLFDDIFGWMVLGLLVAGALAAWLPDDALARLPGGRLGAMAAMILVGVPLYVCAEASTPVAAALIAAGLSPGTALVFLLVGPATNLGALGVLVAALGRATVAIYLAAIVVVALLAGLALDALAGGAAAAPAGVPALAPDAAPGPLATAAAVAFLVLGLGTLRRRGWRRLLAA